MNGEKFSALSERAEATVALGRLWDEGIASGPAIDGAQAFNRVRASLGARVDKVDDDV